MIVETEGLTIRYGATTAIANMTLSAASGSVLAIVGPNGSGKSSFVKAIAGVVPHVGSIRFDGSQQRPDAIAYMAQDIGARAALTVLEVILLGRMRKLGMQVAKADLEAVEDVIRDLGLSHLTTRYLGELSGGQRQIVFLAQALVAEPRVLLLDEPISALDMRHQIEVLELVRSRTVARGLTTLCVLHDLSATARIADHVAIFRQGQLVAMGTPQAVITPATIADVFEVEAEIVMTSKNIPVVCPLHATRRSAAPRSPLGPSAPEPADRS